MSEKVSVIIPCYNEEKYIAECILSILSQKKINNLEIIVVDGMSTDNTKQILQELINMYKDKEIIIVNNTQRITPVALNLGIKRSSGDYICIMGAHAEYDHEFLSNCLGLIKNHPNVSCVGGPILSKGKNDFAKAVAISMSSPIGVGNANHRFPEFEGYAEMACFPFFKREVFDKYGLYDESLVKNQDDEFCFRIRLKGAKIYISNKVKSAYYVKDSFSKLFNQYFSYGKWRIPVLLKHKIPISYRQQIPALFILTIFLLFIIAFYFNNIYVALFLPLFYLIILIGFSVFKLQKEKFQIIKFIPAAVFILHFAYGLGFLSGVFKVSMDKIRSYI
jgi:glycosyltransferase involved in cell wall biosynthesis